MLSRTSFTYYQPDRYIDDGTNVEYLGMPEGLFSFQAFLSEEACREWLKNNGYEPEEFIIHEYKDDDIEHVTIIDEYGDFIPKIEDLSDDEISDLLATEVLYCAGSIDNLLHVRQSDETEDEFNDRLYGDALDEVLAAIESIEDSGEYDFSSYGGHPETDWYDLARDEAVQVVMSWMLGKNAIRLK